MKYNNIVLLAAQFKFLANFYANGVNQLQMVYTVVDVMLKLQKSVLNITRFGDFTEVVLKVHIFWDVRLWCWVNTSDVSTDCNASSSEGGGTTVLQNCVNC